MLKPTLFKLLTNRELVPDHSLMFDPIHVKFYLRRNDLTEENSSRDTRLNVDLTDVVTVQDDCSKVTNQISVHRHSNTRYRDPRNLRVVLGHACNFRCKYCSQEHVALELPTQEKIDSFLQKCDKALDYSQLSIVQFWGGEPLLYWDTIEKMTDAFKQRIPGVGFSIVTNGSLMTEKIADRLIEEENFGVVLSHDGPGQYLRGLDPLTPGTETRKQIFRLLKAKNPLNTYRAHSNQGRNFAVNPVITSASPNFMELVQWYDGIFGQEVPIAEGIPIIPIQPGTEIYTPYANNWEKYEEAIVDTFRSKNIDRFDNYKLQYELFLMKLQMDDYELNPTKALCFTTDPFLLVVDMNGYILPCQTFAAADILDEGRLALCGNLDPEVMGPQIKSRSLVGTMPTINNWTTRGEKCLTCPVVSFCMGGCPYLLGDRHEVDCLVKRHHFTAFLRVYITKLLGVEIDGFELDSSPTDTHV